ncbi:glycoside hydrolase family 52 protein [Caldicellulosiruptoraceae bacterium PP1]
MNLMSDALCVLGSRIGIAIEPTNNKSYLIRHGLHPGIPMNLNIGVNVDGKVLTFPLGSSETKFEFFDQDIYMTRISLKAIDAETGLKFNLSFRIPFKPQDLKFSTVPLFLIELEVEKLRRSFRWKPSKYEEVEGKMFITFDENAFNISQKNDYLTMSYKSYLAKEENYINAQDRVFVLESEPKVLSNGFEKEFKLKMGDKSQKVVIAWASFDPAVLTVLNEKSEFYYKKHFNSIDDIQLWAKENYTEILKQDELIDNKFRNENIKPTLSKLLAYTLHSYLINTWLVVTPKGQDWFTVWEGSCYFHSTVDVEHTQFPFYLYMWPELLEMELNEWVYFGKDGQIALGESGKDTLFLSHDMGVHCNCSGQAYPHDMEVEENCNYILLAFMHWKKTGNDSVIKNHTDFIIKLLDFILKCDIDDDGICEIGCTNTIDDASPAIQFAKKQVYLSVKAACAVYAGYMILDYLGIDAQKYLEFSKKAIQKVENEGWLNDHYVVTLQPETEGIVNPWTKEVLKGKVPGWDAYHIYTMNGLAIFDLLGIDFEMDNQKLKIDAINGWKNTLGKYGCRHSSFVRWEQDEIPLTLEGLASTSDKNGWISMNMLRDITALKRGLDLTDNLERYWDWQLTTNTQGIYMFFETFNGNNLNFYPRGIAAFGYLYFLNK